MSHPALRPIPRSALRPVRFASASPLPPVRRGDVRLAGGVRLHYVEGGDAAGRPVVLLHGYSDSSFSFSRVMPLLPSELHVHALDLRGHGDSDRPVDGYAMRDLAADVLAYMDARGIARAALVGHSMGSFVAQQAALAAPGRVERLVLIGSGTTPRHIVGMDDLAAAVRAFDGPDARAPMAFAREFQLSTVHRPVPAAFMHEAVAVSRRLPARVWQAAMDGMLATDPPTELAALHVPTLLLWGDRDQLLTRAEQGALAALIGTATLKVYEETGHAPHWERPADVARDVAAFLGA